MAIIQGAPRVRSPASLQVYDGSMASEIQMWGMDRSCLCSHYKAQPGISIGCTAAITLLSWESAEGALCHTSIHDMSVRGCYNLPHSG